MIASVRGQVIHVDADGVVIEVAGVGMLVAATSEVVRTARLGDELLLHTALIVREDALSLVGFRSREELTAFHLLVGVSGVGPKSALGVLGAMSVDQIATAVAADDDAPFRRVSGIGPKTAKLIVVQLAGKLVAPVPGRTSTTPAAVGDQVVAALVGLGWAERAAHEVVSTVTANAPASASVPDLLRMALAELGPARREQIRG